MLPTLVIIAVDIIMAIVGALTESLPNLITAAINIIMTLINGILGALPQLIAMVPEIIITIVTGLLTMLPELIVAGVEIIFALIAGILGAIPDLLLGVVDVIIALVDMFSGGTTEFEGVGGDIVSGIWEGIKKAWATFMTNITEKFSEIGTRIKDLFGIASPSKYFAEIGENLNKGMALGIKGTIDLPEKELSVGYLRMPEMYGQLETAGAGSMAGMNIPYQGGNNNNDDILSALDRLPMIMKIALKEAVATLEIR